MQLRLLLFSGHLLWVAALLLALAPAQPVLAQAPSSPAPATPPSKVYNFVEQMPQLPGFGGSVRAIAAAVQSKLASTASTLPQGVQGRVFVNFNVGEDGSVRDATVVKGIGGGCDEAALAAVQQLPKFIPGKQGGKPVTVNLLVPVTFPPLAPAPALPKKR